MTDKQEKSRILIIEDEKPIADLLAYGLTREGFQVQCAGSAGKGWKLVGVTFPGFYHFEACKPGDVSYQLDFPDEPPADNAYYLQMFQDYGWEYICEFNGWSYFRKPRSQGEELPSIFSDSRSRLELIDRVFQRRMVPLLVIFFLLLLPQLITQIQFLDSGNLHPDSFVLTILFSLLLLLYLYVFIRFARKRYLLNREERQD